MKTKQEIHQMIDKANDLLDSDNYSGMSYQDGVKEALEWVLGYCDAPLEDEEN